MKKHLTLFLILLAPLVAQAQGGTFDFKNAPVAMILDVYAKLSARLPLDKPDQCPEDVLNQILWHAQRGFTEPYPRWAITETTDPDDH